MSDIQRWTHYVSNKDTVLPDRETAPSWAAIVITAVAIAVVIAVFRD